MITQSKFRFILRLDQIGVTLIPVLIGLFALLNDVTAFTSNVDSIVKPLITMQNNSSNQWRALPVSLSAFVYTLMFLGEFLVGVLAFVGIILMSKNINQSAEQFERPKQ